MRTLLADLRHALRVIRRTPSFALPAIGVLALGIGASTAIFSIVNAVLLRPLPFEEPERLVRMFTRLPSGRQFDLSAGKFYSWQQHAQSFEGMAMFRTNRYALSGAGSARAVEAGAVSAGFFEIVRARPVLGRVFRPEEDSPDGKYVAILSDRFWKAEFGGASDVIGRTMRLNDQAYTIVGVMPASASVASWSVMARDIWVPMALNSKQRATRGNHNQDGVARLKAGVDLAGAQSEMNAISDRLAREFGQSDKGWGALVVPMQEEIVGGSRTMLVMLLGAVGLVLLIACANVGNLLFTRALNRRKEIAIRAALGAGRRVVQHLLVEALLLAAAGGALGLLLAYVTLTAASTLLASQIPRAEEISIDARVLLFALAVSLLTGMLAGTLPALRAGRTDLNDALKEGGRGETAALGIGTRRLLIVCEVALSLVLLMGAGVMIQSLLALRLGDPGFNPNNVLTMEVSLPGTRYPEPAQRTAFFGAALQRIRALPGVEAAGTIDDIPIAIDGSSQTLLLDGYPNPQNPVAVQARQITPGYMRAMQIPVLRGRDVVDSDEEVMLVSRDVAKLYWGTDDPIGRRAALPYAKDVIRTVVGIVGDVKQRELTGTTTPTVYFYTRNPFNGATFVMRTAASLASPTVLAQPAVAAIRAIDPQQPVTHLRTMGDVLDDDVASQRFSALLLGAFASIALLLAAVGIYSVLSYIVRGRRREIAIRTALGARRADVLRLVIAEGMWPALAGIAAGLIAARASAQVLKTLVFGVSASDPLTLGAVATTLAIVALMASLISAYRVVRLDPMKALRAD
jgi:putative ABC transport system permease protein